MPRQRDTATRLRTDHAMRAASTYVAGVAAGPQGIAEVIANLEGRAPSRPLSAFDAPHGPTGPLLDMQARRRVRAGETVIEIRTRNTGRIGHSFPNGPTDLMQIWLDATLRAQDPTRPPLTDAMRAAFPPVRHPLVAVHPDTGRRSLYIAPDVMEHVEGMGAAEGDALVRALLAHTLAERFVHRHRWRAGDLVMWDNRCTLHTATPFDASRFRRLLYRTIIADVGATPP